MNYLAQETEVLKRHEATPRPWKMICRLRMERWWAPDLAECVLQRKQREREKPTRRAGGRVRRWSERHLICRKTFLAQFQSRSIPMTNLVFLEAPRCHATCPRWSSKQREGSRYSNGNPAAVCANTSALSTTGWSKVTKTGISKKRLPCPLPFDFFTFRAWFVPSFNNLKGAPSVSSTPASSHHRVPGNKVFCEEEGT